MSRAPLSWRAEAWRQLSRRRTVWSLVLVLALPVVIVVAFRLGSSGPVTGTRVVDLARIGSANFTLFAFAVSAELLLVILAALFVGDAVPAEASWSSLRYLLLAPVPRARLLTSKLVVGLASLVAVVVLLVGWSLLVGGLAYGWEPLHLGTGGVLPWSDLLPRLALAMGYVVVSLLQVASIAFWIGTRTDAPLAAVGGSVLVTIVGGILGQIEALGDLRRALPMFYQRAWTDVFTASFDPAPLRHGSLWSLVYVVAFVGLGYTGFRRKDVLS